VIRRPLNPLRRLVSVAATALLLAPAMSVAQGTPTKIKFQLDWRFEGPAALFLLPAAKGYFKQEGLDVTVDAGNGSAGTVNRVASGAYDMGFADVAAMIEFLANNANNPGARMQAVYMLYDSTPASVFALKKSGITKPSDLNGRTLGAPVFDAGRKAFPIFVKANGLDAGKIKWLSMDPPLRETMLVKGEVDAITGFYFTTLLNLNARGIKDEDIVSMKFPDHGVKLYGNSVIVSEKFAKENPKAVQAFLRALNRGVKEVIANPDAAIQFVKERDALIDVALETRRLKLAIDVAVATPEARKNGLGAIERTRFAATLADVASAYSLKTTPEVDGLFTTSFLPPAADRAIGR
jgi:NitT/TauT family transport system substrate-binding protein